MRDLTGPLQECLTALRERENLHEVLRRYPAERDQLVSMLRLSADVSALAAPAADPTFRLRARNRMLSAAAHRRRWRGWTPRAIASRPLVRFAAAGLAAAAVLAVGLRAGASGALPGDPLYAVKIGAEQAQLTITLDPAARARLDLHFAEIRLDEARRLIAIGRVQEGVRLLGQYDSGVSRFNATVASSAWSARTADDLTAYVDERQAQADASLTSLAGSLTAGGNRQAAAAVTRTQSHVDKSLGGSKVALQARAGSPSGASTSTHAAPRPAGQP